MNNEENQSSSTDVVKYADEAMFKAEAATNTSDGPSNGLVGFETPDFRPRVRLLDAPSDPLGKLAFIARAYQGKFNGTYADITDEDRLYYVQDMEKNILGMPSEAVQFHFVLENVTRSFTHQLVRTRHASYAQESMRFAVKEDFPVQLPPHLLGTMSREEWRAHQGQGQKIGDYTLQEPINGWKEYEERYASDQQKARFVWDESISSAKKGYEKLIALGMPAEDARGLSPHAIVTKINWVVDLRALMATAGQRLCTQAQWEHREMWASLIQSIRDYGRQVSYSKPAEGVHGGVINHQSSAWQFDFLANRFKPVCYQTGRCQFRSDFDRYCNIRDRVEKNAKHGRQSKYWDQEGVVSLGMPSTENSSAPIVDTIPAIDPHEWLDPKAAIRPTADWRSEQAQNNIKGRR